METLRTSEFAAFTHIMPGEADDWCASYARDTPRSIIFTGDSDLLLYAYQPEVVVMFFRDTHYLPKSDTRVYCPSSICTRLKLPSLLLLAYVLSEHRTKNMNDNIQIAQSYDAEAPGYIDFSRRYMYTLRGPAYIASSAEFNQILQTLDVRVSEFINQALISSEEVLTPDVYPPLLFEDPHEASAWKLGLDLRLLAYSLIMPESNTVVRESIRRAQDVAGQTHSVLSLETARQIGTELSASITTLITREELLVKQRWFLVALAIALGEIKVPHSFLVARVINGEFDETWAFVHLNARLQAVLYSLRFLKQCISVWLTIHHDDGETRIVVSKLANALQSFPSIADMFDIPGQNTTIREHDAPLHQAIKDVYASAGIEDEELFQEPKTKRQRKREKLRNRIKAQQSAPAPKSTNIFALLEQRTPQ